VRRAVYETSPAGWRLAAHERTAETLASRSAPAEAMAHHVERSARQGDASAVALLVRAGEQAAERAPGTAERWYGGALRLLDDGAPADERVEILLRRAQSLAATGRFRDGHEALVESLGTMHRWAEQALHEAQALGDRTVIAAGHATMALTGAWTGDVAKAEAARTVALGEVDALTDDELATRLDAAANLAAAELYLDHFAECGRHAERVFRVGRATGQGQTFSAMYAAASTALWMDGRLAEAGDVLDGAVDAARLIDDEIGVAWGLFNRAAGRGARRRPRRRARHGP